MEGARHQHHFHAFAADLDCAVRLLSILVMRVLLRLRRSMGSVYTGTYTVSAYFHLLTAGCVVRLLTGASHHRASDCL